MDYNEELIRQIVRDEIEKEKATLEVEVQRQREMVNQLEERCEAVRLWIEKHAAETERMALIQLGVDAKLKSRVINLELQTAHLTRKATEQP